MNPFGQPTAPTTAAPFVLEIPADPTWEPIEFSDVLEQDGVFAAVITAERVGEVNSKPGVWFDFKLQDADVAGKKLSKFMIDPRVNEKVLTFWRKLLMSIGGSKEAGKGGLQYTPGRLTGQIVYFKTEGYVGSKGDVQTGVQDFMTKTEYDAHVAQGRSRWPVAATLNKPSGFGGSPTGLPTGIPQPTAVGQAGPTSVQANPSVPFQPIPQTQAAAPSLPAVPAAIPQPPAAPKFNFPGMK